MSEETGNAAESTANPGVENEAARRQDGKAGSDPVRLSASPPSASNGITPAVSQLTAAELATVRELTIKANPDAVPELIAGGTIAEVQASVDAAKAAYARIAERLRVPPTLGGSATETTGAGAGAATPATGTTPAGDGGAPAAASSGVTPLSLRDLPPTRGESPPVVPGGGAAVDVTASLSPAGKIAAGLRSRR